MKRFVLFLLLMLVLAGLLAVCCYQPGPPATQSAKLPATSGPTHEHRPHIYAGLPRPTRPMVVKVLRNIGYVVGYSEERRDPLWAAYRLFRTADPQTHPRPSRFRIDDRTEARVRHEDFVGSGYDRGHMAPNYGIDVCYGRGAQLETFLMSNVCPQLAKLNQGLWQELEMTVARDYANRFEEVWVVTGPIFEDQPNKLTCGVHVPGAFYKIVVDEKDGGPRMLAFILPQSPEPGETLKALLVSVDAVERQTGLDFFHELEDELEQKLETETPSALWN